MTFNEQRIEQIARRYCELKGLDPEELAGTWARKTASWTSSADLPVHMTRWQVVAERIKDEWTLDAAQWDSQAAAEQSSTEPSEPKT